MYSSVSTVPLGKVYSLPFIMTVLSLSKTRGTLSPKPLGINLSGSIPLDIR